MTVTPSKFPPLFRKPKINKISMGSGVRLVAVDCSDYFLLTLQDIFNPNWNFTFRKKQAIKNIQIFTFLIIPVGL